MKRKRFLAGAAILSLLFAGCGANNSTTTDTGSAVQTKETAETVELNIFAAASMQETLEQITEDYKSVDPSVEIVLNLDSSGTLKTQIEEGAASLFPQHRSR